MIWEQETQVIVMTTKTVERGRVKCGQYWPEEENTSQEFGDFEVFNSGIECFADYTISNLVLTNKKVCFQYFNEYIYFFIHILIEIKFLI